MAKEALKEVATTTTASSMPAHLVEAMQGQEPKGVSTAREHNLVPRVYLLQALSPQVRKTSADYVEGAEPGSIWLRNAPTPLVSGDEGILVQPCFFHANFVEWRLRDNGGGLIGEHEDMPDDAKEVEDGKRKRWMRPNGNEVVETQSRAVRVFTPDGVMPFIVSMTSTGLTVSKGWMTMCNVTGAHSWFRKYRLRTKEKTNALGSWFIWDVQAADWVTKEEAAAGEKLYQSFADDELKAEADIDAEGVTDQKAPF